MTHAAGNGAGDGPGGNDPAGSEPIDFESEARAKQRVHDADRRMADAEALLEVASAQLAVAARNIASANAAEREYRRAVWHYTQLMKHRISNPLQTIIGMADTLRDMPDLERSRRQAMIEAIGQQARVLRDVSLEPRVVAETERVLRPAPHEPAVQPHRQQRDEVSAAQTGELPVTRSGGDAGAGQAGTAPAQGQPAKGHLRVEPLQAPPRSDTPDETPDEKPRRSPFTRFGRERWNDSMRRDD